MRRHFLKILPAIGLLAATSLSHPLSAEGPPDDTARSRLTLGMGHFRENKIAESIRDFDRAAELDRPIAPQLWHAVLATITPANSTRAGDSLNCTRP